MARMRYFHSLRQAKCCCPVPEILNLYCNASLDGGPCSMQIRNEIELSGLLFFDEQHIYDVYSDIRSPGIMFEVYGRFVRKRTRDGDSFFYRSIPLIQPDDGTTVLAFKACGEHAIIQVQRGGQFFFRHYVYDTPVRESSGIMFDGFSNDRTYVAVNTSENTPDGIVHRGFLYMGDAVVQESRTVYLVNKTTEQTTFSLTENSVTKYVLAYKDNPLVELSRAPIVDGEYITSGTDTYFRGEKLPDDMWYNSGSGSHIRSHISDEYGGDTEIGLVFQSQLLKSLPASDVFRAGGIMAAVGQSNMSYEKTNYGCIIYYNGASELFYLDNKIDDLAPGQWPAFRGKDDYLLIEGVDPNNSNDVQIYFAGEDKGIQSIALGSDWFRYFGDYFAAYRPSQIAGHQNILFKGDPVDLTGLEDYEVDPNASNGSCPFLVLTKQEIVGTQFIGTRLKVFDGDLVYEGLAATFRYCCNRMYIIEKDKPHNIVVIDKTFGLMLFDGNFRRIS